MLEVLRCGFRPSVYFCIQHTQIMHTYCMDAYIYGFLKTPGKGLQFEKELYFTV